MRTYTKNYCIYLEALFKILNCYVRNYINSSSSSKDYNVKGNN